MNRFLKIAILFASTMVAFSSCEKEDKDFEIDGTSWKASEFSSSNDDFGYTSLKFEDGQAALSLVLLTDNPASDFVLTIMYDYTWNYPTAQMSYSSGVAKIGDEYKSLKDLNIAVSSAYAHVSKDHSSIDVNFSFNSENYSMTLFYDKDATKSGEASMTVIPGSVMQDIVEMVMEKLNKR